MAILVLLSLALVLVVYQDFRQRAVFWFVFPVLFLLAFLHAADLSSLSFRFIAVNTAVLAVQFGLLYVYFWVKDRKRLMHGEHYIGWGDILFLGMLTLCFSPLNFVFFLIGSLTVILLGVLLFSLMGYRVGDIPLAGGQALLLLCVLWLDHGRSGASLYDDSHLTGVFFGFGRNGS